jgi:RNA polymerase sigma-70 factor (ECF subfamily)
MSDGALERRKRFEAAYRELYAPICGYALRRVREPEDAAEVIAETFATLWRRFDRCPQGEQLRPWLYGVARRVIANQRRSTRRRAALAERVARTAPTRESPADEEASLVQAALRRLGPRDREVLLLSEWEGLSPAQIASVQRCTRVTARGRLHRARRRFRSTFEELLAGEHGERCSHQVSESPAASVTHVLGGGS